MIIFKKLKFRNFLSYGNNFTEIDLNTPGLILINGSNFQGKSSISSALAFGLFNKSERGNKVQLINTINKKELEIIVEFQKGTSEYTIRRGMKPNIFEIYKDGVLINQDSSSRDYQTYLENEILNLNYRTFYQTIILSSTSFVPFMQLPAGSRREVVEDLLNISIFSKMRQVLKTRLDDNRNRLRDLGSSIALQKEKLKQYKEYQNILNNEASKRREEILEKLNQNKNRMKDSAQKVLEINREFKRLSDDLSKKEAEYTRKHKEYESKKTHVKIASSDIKKRLDFFENTDLCPTCCQTIDEKTKQSGKETEQNRLKEIQDTISVVDELKSILDKEQKDIKQFNKECDILNSQLQENVFIISSYESENADLERSLKKLEESPPSMTESEESLYSRLIELEEEKTYEQENQTYLISCQEMLKDTGMKGVMIRKYLPIINTLINKYLAAMDFFVSFNLDENFNEVVKSRHRDNFSYDAFSEGEKARLNLAILFTWRQIARLKNSTSCNLLFLDEVFSSVLDQAGVEKLTEILVNETEASKNTIFVITHSDAVKSGIEFSKTLYVSKVKNFSTIAESLVG